MKPSFFKRLFSWIFSRKTALRVLFTLILLATLLMIFHRVETWRGRKAWREYEKTAVERGTQLRLSEFVTPAIPDDQNFAAVRLFNGRFGTSAEKKAADDMLPRLNEEGLKRPILGNSFEGKTTALSEWRDYFVKAKAITSPGDNAAMDIIAMLDQSPGLREIRAASHRPKSRFPIDIEKGFAMELPHLTTIQSCATLLSLGAEARFTAGDSAGALEDVRLLIRLADASRDEPYLIALLVRASVLQRAIGAIHSGIVRGAWNEEQLASLEERLATQNLIAGLRFAMASERAAMTTELDRLANSSTYEDNPIWKSLGTSPAMSFTFPRGWIYRNMVLGNELHDKMLNSYGSSDGKTLDFIASSPKNLTKEAEGFTGLDRFRFLFVLMIMPSLDSVEKTALFNQSLVNQARIAIALERNKLASGAYVNNLEAMTPFLVPNDPCDGKPMRYRKTDVGYEIWSIGTNRTDENGKAESAVSNVRDQPDWVWSHPARSTEKK
jgi:hypothetical protein